MRSSQARILRSLLVCLMMSAAVVSPVTAAQAGPPPSGAASSTVTPTPGATTSGAAIPGVQSDLERAKLEQEIRKLELENERSASWLGVLLLLAPFVTVLVAIATFAAALAKQRSDNREQRIESSQTRLKEVQTRFDEQFSAAASGLGSDSPGLQAAGAASLLRIQQTADRDFQRDLLLFVVAELRVGVDERIAPILREVFAYASRTVFDGSPGAALSQLNLTGAKLQEVDLSNVSLKGAAVCLEDANLSGANLQGTILWGIRGDGLILDKADCRKTNFGPSQLNRLQAYSCNFDGARLGSAKMRDAHLNGSTFRGAELQSAHFSGAELMSVDFSHADINQAIFVGATMNDVTRESLNLAKNHGSAHF